MLGLRRGTIQLVPYQKAWGELFLEERTRLKALLGDGVVDIQHIGSTAVPGLSAKPILDVGVAVRDFDEAFGLIKPLEVLGYAYRGEKGVARRHLFVEGPPDRRTHHLHGVEHETSEWRNLLFFRDYLRVHPEAVTRYQTLKAQLARQFPEDQEAYTGGKHAVIQDILNRA